MMKKYKLGRNLIINEGICEITNNPQEALILSQFIHSWRIRCEAKDIIDGRKTTKQNYDFWIRKNSKEIIRDSFLNIRDGQARKHIKSLVESGYLLEQVDPTQHPCDHTKSYKLNFPAIIEELNRKGYTL